MPAKCNVETLRDNLTLKLDIGKYVSNSVSIAVLKSKDGEEVFEFPTRVYYFDKLNNLQSHEVGDLFSHSLGKIYTFKSF